MTQIIHGDCTNEMHNLEENSVDSIVTDPPYGLAFMGKSWDDFKPKEFQKFSEKWGQLAFKVLKPGGYLLAFCGTRTYHRMVVGLENAGFEIKDQIDWLYGQGFPKSHDISKQIDKHFFKEWLNDNPEIKKEYKKELQGAEGKEKKEIKKKYKRKAGLEREEIGGKKYADGRDYTKEDDFKKRKSGEKNDDDNFNFLPKGMKSRTNALIRTAPATPEAKNWQGWGTALKPSHEPIVVAQKPRERTYAENVLKHGVGVLNIDGCRIGFNSKEDKQNHDYNRKGMQRSNLEEGEAIPALTYGTYYCDKEIEEQPKGRWPANVLLDPQAAQMLNRQSGVSKSTSGVRRNSEVKEWKGGKSFTHKYQELEVPYDDKGGASRFFYSSKAHKSERNAGLEDLEKGDRVDVMSTAEWQKDRGRNPDEYEGMENDIATLKPINLMRWLTRLVTPDHGTVLDPFAGSGTTGCACEIENFGYILIEKRKRFANLIAPKRCEYWSKPENWSDLKDHEAVDSPQTKRNKKLSDFAR